MKPAISAGAVAALFLSVALLERSPRLRLRPSPFLRRYLSTDAAWYAITTAVNTTAAFLLLPTLRELAVPGVRHSIGHLPWAARFALAVVLYDCFSFLVHVGLHKSETLWTVHKVHHSSRHLDWLATTRAHLMENLVRQVSAQLPLFALGMTAAVVSPTLVAYAAFAVLGHSNLRFRSKWVELLFVTPRIHRIHHVPATSQCNFGTIFTVWDRMFARFLSVDPQPDEPLGVPGEIDAYPQRLLPAFRRPFQELRRRRVDAIVLAPVGRIDPAGP
jgi:sterol desaturase/sphingolipid hydroxylase (fatty acid hydroxylase superfamily)